MLLRIFPQFHSAYRPERFERLDRVPEGELRIHTWLDVSLKELAVLVCESNQSARKHGTRFAFAAIYRDGCVAALERCACALARPARGRCPGPCARAACQPMATCTCARGDWPHPNSLELTSTLLLVSRAGRGPCAHSFAAHQPHWAYDTTGSGRRRHWQGRAARWSPAPGLAVPDW